MPQHIIIVGAGITGAALAYRLAQSGDRVTVLDTGTPASAASGASFGWINASFFASDAHHALRACAIEAHRRLDAEVPTPTHWPGCLWWEEQGAGMDSLMTSLRALDYPVEEVGGNQIATLEPGLATPPPRALRFPAEGATDLAALTRRLLAASGAQVCTGVAVTSLGLAKGRVIGVLTPQGALAADHVVLATGTGTPALLSHLGLSLPMLHRPGLMMTTRPQPRLLAHICVTPGQELRQDAVGRIWAPTAASHQSDSAEGVPAMPQDLADAAYARLAALLPGLSGGWDRVSLAYRPVPADGVPVVGQAMPGLSVAVMHSGATLAPLVAELLAAEITGQGTSPLLAPFRPSRFT